MKNSTSSKKSTQADLHTNKKKVITSSDLISKLIPDHVIEWQYHLLYSLYSSEKLLSVKDFFHGVVTSIDQVLEVYNEVWYEDEYQECILNSISQNDTSLARKNDEKTKEKINSIIWEKYEI